MYLLLILSCIFTISVIILLNIKDPLQQVFVFLITLIVFMGFNFLFGDLKVNPQKISIQQLYNESQQKLNEQEVSQDVEIVDAQAETAEVAEAQLAELSQAEEVESEEVSVEIQNKIIEKVKEAQVKGVNYLLNPLNSEDYDPAYTPDKIIPNCAYNIGDCTNDLSCIIPPDNANLFGPLKPKNPSLAPKKMKHPERKCKELPKITIDRTKHCSNCGGILPSAKKIKSNCSDIEKVVNNYDRLCLHCKVGVRMNENCFNGRDLPIEYYPI